MPSTPYTPPTAAEFEAASVVIRARSQIARLQAIIDSGIGERTRPVQINDSIVQVKCLDVGRAVKIRDILESSILHCREHEAASAVGGRDTQLAYTLYDWAPAINSVCDQFQREQVAA
jgi:hypothetical protein